MESSFSGQWRLILRMPSTRVLPRYPSNSIFSDARGQGAFPGLKHCARELEPLYRTPTLPISTPSIFSVAGTYSSFSAFSLVFSHVQFFSFTESSNRGTFPSSKRPISNASPRSFSGTTDGSNREHPARRRMADAAMAVFGARGRRNMTEI